MIIGITGGVGCGKSTVLHILKQEFHCYTIEADKVGHLVMQKGTEAYQQIVSTFGNEILDTDLEIDRKRLAGIVFSDREKLKKLNQIVHPAIKSHIKNEIEQVTHSGNHSIIILEAALLIEEKYPEFCDEVWYIYADEQERIRRLKKSRGYTEEKIREIMENQLSEEEFLKNCDRKIDNSRDFEAACQQIKKLFERFTYGR